MIFKWEVFEGVLRRYYWVKLSRKMIKSGCKIHLFQRNSCPRRPSKCSHWTSCSWELGYWDSTFRGWDGSHRSRRGSFRWRRRRSRRAGRQVGSSLLKCRNQRCRSCRNCRGRWWGSSDPCFSSPFLCTCQRTGSRHRCTWGNHRLGSWGKKDRGKYSLRYHLIHIGGCR